MSSLLLVPVVQWNLYSKTTLGTRLKWSLKTGSLLMQHGYFMVRTTTKIGKLCLCNYYIYLHDHDAMWRKKPTIIFKSRTWGFVDSFKLLFSYCKMIWSQIYIERHKLYFLKFCISVFFMTDTYIWSILAEIK